MDIFNVDFFAQQVAEQRSFLQTHYDRLDQESSFLLTALRSKSHAWTTGYMYRIQANRELMSKIWKQIDHIDKEGGNPARLYTTG